MFEISRWKGLELTLELPKSSHFKSRETTSKQLNKSHMMGSVTTKFRLGLLIPSLIFFDLF